MAPVIKGTSKQSIRDLLSFSLPDIEIKMAPTIEFITTPGILFGLSQSFEDYYILRHHLNRTT